jgi:hypothetical protein
MVMLAISEYKFEYILATWTWIGAPDAANAWRSALEGYRMSLMMG